MTDTEIQALGFVALRALAEYDHIEFRRLTDISRSELDRAIKSLLSNNDTPEAAQFYRQIIGVRENVANEVASGYFMRQIYTSCNAVAQFNSLIDRADGNYRANVEGGIERTISSDPLEEVREDELLRLSVMKLLQTLRGYTPTFHRRIFNYFVDCLLEPNVSSHPYIFVETRRHRSSRSFVEDANNRLVQILRIFDLRAIGLIIASSQSIPANVKLGDQVIFIRFDLNKNEFVGDDFQNLLVLFERFDYP